MPCRFFTTYSMLSCNGHMLPTPEPEQEAFPSEDFDDFEFAEWNEAFSVDVEARVVEEETVDPAQVAILTSFNIVRRNTILVLEETSAILERVAEISH
jgi:ribosomal protein L30/L7E